MSAIRTFVLGSLIGVAAFVATTASAASLTPVNSGFSASGPTNLTGPGGVGGPCTSTFYGSIDAFGNGTINGPASTFVGSSLICSVIKGQNTWQLVPTSPTTGELRNVRVVALGLIACQGTVRGTLVGGVFTFDTVLPGNCRVSGTLSTWPTVGIVWP
ncbi:hypothetical protein ABU614_18800 [Lysobacter firmicutimachus]|uniref:Protein activator of alkane oxidation PraB n=1 Tax=Lysobacter firmicutimachus TaxID=1792846 RepID=A0AAU8MT36_9GAMM